MRASRYPLKITRAEDAEQLVTSALEALDRLEPLIEEETRLFKSGKAREALNLAVEKNQAAQIYNPLPRVAEAQRHCDRTVPTGQSRTTPARHEAFSAKMALNMAVVATARTVSEGLLRDLADAVGKNGSPKTYVRGGVTRKAGTAPLSISRAI